MTRKAITDDPRLTNLFGPLDAKIRARLHQVLHNPRKYWNRDHGLMLRGMKRNTTLWQVIIVIDPTFPRHGQRTDQAGNVVQDWERYPDSVLIGRAIRYALTGEGA